MNPLTNTKNLQKINEKELQLGLTGTKSSWHDGYKNSAWIFVGGFPYELTEGDLITMFSQYGEIANINMPRDKITGKQKGFAFICYEDQRSTILAVDNLNSITILSRTIRVDHVKDYKAIELKGTEDEITQKIRMEGCGPEVNIEKFSTKLRKKDNKSGDDDGKKKKKKHGSESGSDEEIKMRKEVEMDETNTKIENNQKTTLKEVNDRLKDLQTKINSCDSLGRDGECGRGTDRSDIDRTKSNENLSEGGGIKKSSKSASYSSQRDTIQNRRKYDNDALEATSSSRHDDDDEDNRKHKIRNYDNYYRISKSSRNDDDDDRSKNRIQIGYERSLYKKRCSDDDDTRRSSKYRRDYDDHKREKSPQRHRRS